MYQSRISITPSTTSENKKVVRKYMNDSTSHKCFLLKRRIELCRFVEANEKRADASIRFASFLVGIDILKKSKDYTQKIIDGFVCYEIQGLAKNKELVMVHIREEKTEKGKQLFLISTFYKK